MDFKNIFTVSELTQRINHNLESAFPIVWVKGQVTNLSRPASGHIYFSLKDENASIAMVWFKEKYSSPKFDIVTGEVFEAGQAPDISSKLQNGQELICAGKLAVYAIRGQYQLIIEYVQESGIGKLHEEFERLKLKLATKGFFDQKRKRPLPKNPKKIALLTSPSGAVLQDFIKISQTKGVGAKIRLYPVLVQGKEAPNQLIQTIEKVNKEAWAEVLVIIRGGGSLEDLWAFNDEALAEAVVNSKIPVLAGIGHEPDFTMLDMSADVRAATPSHAAQLLWIDRYELMQRLDELSLRLEQKRQTIFLLRRERLNHLTCSLSWLSPQKKLVRHQQQLSLITGKTGSLNLAFLKDLTYKKQQLTWLNQRLKQSLSSQSYKSNKDKLEFLSLNLIKLYDKHVFQKATQLKMLTLKLESLNPLQPLERGYALIQKDNGNYINSIKNVQTGDNLNIQLSDGKLNATVN